MPNTEFLNREVARIRVLHGLQAGIAGQRHRRELDRHITQIEGVTDGNEADNQQKLHLIGRQPEWRFFHESIFPAKWNPVSRRKMRLTNSCEYGRECAAGQPGAGRFFEATEKKH
jgi:hypothetical protein